MADNVNPTSDSGSDWGDWDDWGSDTSTQSETVSADEGNAGVVETPMEIEAPQEPTRRPPRRLSSRDRERLAQQSAQQTATPVAPQPSNDDWDNWGAESTPAVTPTTPAPAETGSFIQPTQDDWGLEDDTPQQQPNDWGSMEEPIQESPMQFDNTGVQNMSPIQEVRPPRQVNLGKKTVGFILAGALVVLALVFMFFDGIKINKKPDNQQQVQQTQQSQQQPSQQTPTQQAQQSQGNQSGGQNTNVASGSVTLIEIPNTTALNYSGDILETSGTVLTKTKYVQAHQVLYCITIRVAVGSSVEDINYYCNYASFNAVKVGDLLIIKYQQVDDNYISVNEVLK